jgi:glycosyltransferase involved in cell wall biosynthesis
LKILITNAYLATYGGTQVVVRDLACELKRQGHEVAVYCPEAGSVADEIREQGIPVAHKLTSLNFVPDIIHGQFHLPAMEALLRFAAVPAIYCVHAAVGALDEPFYFPRFLRYVAVDDRCRKRLENTPGIPRERIRVILNAVNLDRFQSRSPLPAKPRRALVFSNYASESTYVPEVRKACRQTGLELDVVGLGSGNPVARPETILPGYDIVFAKARAALEAMAVGAAVVLCDAPGLGLMVTTKDFDHLRAMNFGAGVLDKPLRADAIRKEIERYNPSDAAQVYARVRNEAGMVESARQWAHVYGEVIEEFARIRSGILTNDADREFEALTAYLRKPGFDDRVEWERQQLKRLKSIPLIGPSVFRLARRILMRWTGYSGLR